jgi:pimeloyl-ACP methyl ester carboxylesterase
MASFVLVPGAGGVAWYWHRVVPLLERAGHDALPVELPGDDKKAGLDAYVDIVLRTIGGRSDVVLVAQSLAGFTAPQVCARAPVQRLVFINAMIPNPGETAGAWGTNTGSNEARTSAAKRRGYSPEFDLATYFLHDVPEDVQRDGESKQRDEADTIFEQPCRFKRWPEVPIHILVGADDRLFPADFQARVARERLHKDVDVIPGGHLVALSNPDGVAERLLAYEHEGKQPG